MLIVPSRGACARVRGVGGSFMEKPMESVRAAEPVFSSAPAKKRATWQPLAYEKLDAAQAQSGFTGLGGDNAVYS